MGAVAFLFDFRSKGFEQGGSEAEEKASGKPFCRRGNERSEAIGAAAPGQNPLLSAKSSTTIDTIVSMVVLLIYSRKALWYKGL